MGNIDGRSLWRNRSRSGVNGNVYFIRCQDFVKIGFTTNAPEKRCHALQAGNPGYLELWFYFPGTLADEQALHQVFDPLLMHREWFAMRGKLRDLVWYCGHDDHERFRSREFFEAAMVDCVECGTCPDDEDTDEHNATARFNRWINRC